MAVVTISYPSAQLTVEETRQTVGTKTTLPSSFQVVAEGQRLPMELRAVSFLEVYSGHNREAVHLFSRGLPHRLRYRLDGRQRHVQSRPTSVHWLLLQIRLAFPMAQRP